MEPDSQVSHDALPNHHKLGSGHTAPPQWLDSISDSYAYCGLPALISLSMTGRKRNKGVEIYIQNDIMETYLLASHHF